MCYKRYMRKWMAERLKRRKKAQDKKSQEPAQAPLQPAYFDAQPSEEPPVREETAAGEAKTPARDPLEDSGLIETPEPEQSPIAANVQGGDLAQGTQARPRRRRTRGGRGRGRQRSGGRAASEAAATAAPAAEPAVERVVAEPVPVAPAAAPRPPKGTVVLAIGLPGSGKSSWFKRNSITPLSSDVVRMLLFDDPNEQRFQDLVFSNLRSMLKARLIARRPLNYVDATNLTPHDRAGWIKLAKDYGYEVQALFFDVPLEVCLERNRRRHRTVDEDVMRRMAGKLRPPTFGEGFSKVTVVRVKKKADEASG
jgi:predicted kinase